MTRINIICEEYDEYDYEFTVVLPQDHKYRNDYLFIGHYTNGFEAERKAIEVGGIVIHNVRIQGRKKK